MVFEGLVGTYKDPWPVSVMPHAPTNRRHCVTAEKYHDWDYLKSGQHQIVYGQQKEKGFKPGWKRLKAESQIKQYDDRKKQEQEKELKQSKITQVRHNMLSERNLYNGYDVIKGIELNQETKEWSPCEVPKTILPTSSLRKFDNNEQKEALRARWESRAQMMKQEGLTQTKKEISMDKILNWD
eukprot:TRINITY_DN7288_c6_g2_i1.p1 TRINITY_DN7288_c6_g2~~TRINITY_DN7288_c6_g2_i1.p1  ORF type:complete len:183 (-),score=21.81 TRINITY_DN7288_c6_g2_i1:162-710(-)